MKRDATHLSVQKTIVFSLIPLIVLFLILEIGFRAVVYQHRSRHALALGEIYEKLRHSVSVMLAERRYRDLGIPNGTMEALYTEEGKPLLEAFQRRYEQHFVQLIQATSNVQSKLLVVYVPYDDFHSKTHQMETNRKFFSALAARHDVPFLDLTERFLQYPSNVVTLLPADNHLSRFGNRLLAEEVGQAIERNFPNHRSETSFDETPDLLGDLRPNDDSVWLLSPVLPYKMRTNSQGLRMSYDLEFPKKRQRILVLGDSVTFGPFLHNHDTYPEMLNAMYPDKEFANAGIQGYTVFQQLSLFEDRAKYAAPDITVLQVLDNDLYDFYYFRLNVFDRERRAHEPTALEQALLKRLRDRELQ